MKTFALVAISLVALSALPLAAAAEEYAGVCTPPTPPVGACATASVGTTTLWYSEPHVGETWSYECDPYALVCVLTPDTYYTYGYVVVPWVYADVDAWCDFCAKLLDVSGIDADELVAPIVLS